MNDDQLAGIIRIPRTQVQEGVIFQFHPLVVLVEVEVQVEAALARSALLLQRSLIKLTFLD
jgi:hypothetical protein